MSHDVPRADDAPTPRVNRITGVLGQMIVYEESGLVDESLALMRFKDGRISRVSKLTLDQEIRLLEAALHDALMRGEQSEVSEIIEEKR